jgi:hypothetical protein
MVARCHRYAPRSYVVSAALQENKKGPVVIGSNKTPSERGGIEAGQVGGVLTRASYGGA